MQHPLPRLTEAMTRDGHMQAGRPHKGGSGDHSQWWCLGSSGWLYCSWLAGRLAVSGADGRWWLTVADGCVVQGCGPGWGRAEGPGAATEQCGQLGRVRRHAVRHTTTGRSSGSSRPSHQPASQPRPVVAAAGAGRETFVAEAALTTYYYMRLLPSQFFKNTGNASQPSFNGSSPGTEGPLSGITACQSFFLYDLDQVSEARAEGRGHTHAGRQA